MMPTEPRSIHPQRVHSVIIPINLPSLARAERTSVPRKNSPSDHASACIRRARDTESTCSTVVEERVPLNRVMNARCQAISHFALSICLASTVNSLSSGRESPHQTATAFGGSM